MKRNKLINHNLEYFINSYFGMPSKGDREQIFNEIAWNTTTTEIPKTKIELFETYSNKDYIFEYNPRKTLNEQNVSKTAKAIIGLLFRDY